MRTFAIAAVMAVLSGWGLAGRADAQVIGTYGTPQAGLGYYSPYPGALYSPFRAPTPVYGYGYNPGFGSRVIVTPNYYYNGYPPSGFTITRFNSFSGPSYPRYGYGYSRGYRR